MGLLLITLQVQPQNFLKMPKVFYILIVHVRIDTAFFMAYVPLPHRLNRATLPAVFYGCFFPLCNMLWFG